MVWEKEQNILEDCNMHANYTDKIIHVLQLDAFTLQDYHKEILEKINLENVGSL